MSSTIISPIPSALPGVCNPQIVIGLPETNITRPYCAFSWPQSIPDLQDCCKEGAQVYTFNNCVRYCERDVNNLNDLDSWRNCVIEKEPSADVDTYQFPCYLERNATATTSSSVSVSVTPSATVGSTSSSASPTSEDASAQSTPAAEEEGKISSDTH